MMMEAESSDQSLTAKLKEEFYSVVRKPGSNYLFHFTPEKALQRSHMPNRLLKSCCMAESEKL